MLIDDMMGLPTSVTESTKSSAQSMSSQTDSGKMLSATRKVQFIHPRMPGETTARFTPTGFNRANLQNVHNVKVNLVMLKVCRRVNALHWVCL